MTIKDLLAQTVRTHGANVALRFKQGGLWRTCTYAELQRRVWCAAEVLAGLGLRPGDRVALLLENRPEWPEIYLAITGLGLTAVPVDVKLQAQEVAGVLLDAGVRALFVEAEHPALPSGARHQLPALETVLTVGGAEAPGSDTGGFRTLAYEAAARQAEAAALAPGRAYDRSRPEAEDLASLIYTSGTTGRQKGAMLSHRNFLSNVEGMLQVFEVSPDDNFLLVLPLHHAFAFNTNFTLPLARGAAITLVESIKTVGDDMRATSPTVLIAVPLLLEKMYQRVMAGLRGHPAGRLLYAVGILGPVRRALQAKFGGRLRLMVSGGAPCDVHVLRGFMRLGFPVVEGYGLTETAPVLTLNPPHHPKPGSVGVALPGVDIKILEPDAEGIGEIVARGPNVMRGYYNHPEATAAVFHEGWFLTGDLGFLDTDGYVHITGRKKNLIVNREGKNINPEEVEAQVLKSPYIREALAVGYREPGERIGERVGLVVVPQPEALEHWAAKEHRAPTKDEIERLIRTELKHHLRHIADYKRPRRIEIREAEFEKTSTGKIKRYLYSNALMA